MVPSNPTPNSESLLSPSEGADEEARNLSSKLAATANLPPFPLTLLRRVAASLRGQETATTSLSLSLHPPRFRPPGPPQLIPIRYPVLGLLPPSTPWRDCAGPCPWRRSFYGRLLHCCIHLTVSLSPNLHRRNRPPPVSTSDIVFHPYYPASLPHLLCHPPASLLFVSVFIASLPCLLPPPFLSFPNIYPITTLV